MKLFDLFATLTLDTSGFNNGVKQATGQGSALAGSLESVVARGTAMGNAVWNVMDRGSRAVWNFATDLVETAAEVQAEEAQFASVFAGMTEDASGVFQRLSEANNIYYTRLRGAGTSFFAQFKAGGSDAATAMGQMEQALQLTADAAAFCDISLEEAAQMLRSFLRGNVEAGEAIHLFSNDVTRTNKAMELYQLKWDKLNEAQREAVLLAIAQDTYTQSGALGQAAREARSYANVLGNIKEVWRQIKKTLGVPILEAVLPVVEKLQEFLLNNPEIVENFAKAIGVLADGLGNLAISLINFISEHADEIVKFMEGVMPLIEALFPREGPTSDSNRKSDLVRGDGSSLEDYAADQSAFEPDLAADGDAAMQAMLDYIRAEDMMEDLGDERATARQQKVFNDALAAFEKALTADQQEKLKQLLEDSGMYEQDSEWRKNKDNEILQSVLDSLPGIIADATGAAVSGMSVTIDGHTLVGYVSAAQGRNARNSKHTGLPANA